MQLVRNLYAILCGILYATIVCNLYANFIWCYQTDYPGKSLPSKAPVFWKGVFGRILPQLPSASPPLPNTCYQVNNSYNLIMLNM